MNNPRHYCTYFDQVYLTRALALYMSLNQHSSNFCLWALCFDDVSYQRLTDLNLAEVRPISYEEFTCGDELLLAARENRSLIEYYFTCSPSLPIYVLNHNPDIDQITYLDADLYFFNSPEPIFAEIGQASIAIIPHRFHRAIRHLESTGIFNVGWLTFRRDEEGLACLTLWRNQCLEWCFDRIEGTRYADQGYLNDWPERYYNLIILKHKGANLAPWNFQNFRLQFHHGGVFVDDDPLIFFHFQSLARISPGIYKLNLRKYRTIPSSLVRNKIYSPYIQELESIFSSQNINGRDERVRSPNDMISIFSNCRNDSSIRTLKELIKSFRDIINGEYIFQKISRSIGQLPQCIK